MMLFLTSVYSFVAVVIAILLMGVYRVNNTDNYIIGVMLSILGGIFWFPVALFILLMSIEE